MMIYPTVPICLVLQDNRPSRSETDRVSPNLGQGQSHVRDGIVAEDVKTALSLESPATPVHHSQSEVSDRSVLGLRQVLIQCPEYTSSECLTHSVLSTRLEWSSPIQCVRALVLFLHHGERCEVRTGREKIVNDSLCKRRVVQGRKGDAVGV